MQTVSRYLISNSVIAFVSGYHGRNSKVYDRRITLHRGVSTPITFTFKNEDQKAQDVTSKTYEFNMIDTESKKSVLTRNLTILDDGSTQASKGTASLTITEGDLLGLDAKFYNFAVREVKSDNSREVTYSDTGYNAAGSLEVIDGAYPEALDSTRISTFTGTGGPLEFTSGAIDGKPGINNNKALHTIAVYTTNFSGALKVQGTMASSPSDSDFFDITMDSESDATISDLTSSGISYYNFFGVYHSVRFSWDNATDNTGKIDKILYRQ